MVHLRRGSAQIKNVYTDLSGHVSSSRNNETRFDRATRHTQKRYWKWDTCKKTYKHLTDCKACCRMLSLLGNTDSLWEWECDVRHTKPWPLQSKTPVNNLLPWNFTPQHGASSTLIPLAWIALHSRSLSAQLCVSLSRSTFLLLPTLPPQAPWKSLPVQPRFDLKAQVICYPANFR